MGSKTQDKQVVTPQETEPDLPESSEVSGGGVVNSGLQQGQGH